MRVGFSAYEHSDIGNDEGRDDYYNCTTRELCGSSTAALTSADVVILHGWEERADRMEGKARVSSAKASGRDRRPLTL